MDEEYIITINNLIDEHQTVVSDSKMVHFEMLKAKIKSTTISYGIKKKHNNLYKEKLLSEKIEKLTKLIGNCPEDCDAINNLEKEKQKLEIYNLNKTKGAQIRSRVKYIQDGEKNSKYFFCFRIKTKRK